MDQQEQQRQEQDLLRRAHEILHGDDDAEIDRLYEAELGQFADAERGVEHNDIVAAMIARDAGRLDIVAELHAGRLHEIGPHLDLDYLPSIEYLKFL